MGSFIEASESPRITGNTRCQQCGQQATLFEKDAVKMQKKSNVYHAIIISKAMTGLEAIIMAGAIEITDIHREPEEFAGIKTRTYLATGFPLKLDTAMKWLIVSGEAEIICDSRTEKMICKPNDIIYFHKTSLENEPTKFKTVRINVPGKLVVKRTIADQNELLKRKTNIMINYLLIMTVLKVLKKYKTFTESGFYFSNDIFLGALKGDIYYYFDTCEEADKQLSKIDKATGIPMDIWLGKKRLKTGMRLNTLSPDDIRRYRIKTIDDYKRELALDDENGIDLRTVELDPLGFMYFKKTEIYQNYINESSDIEGKYDLKSLITICALYLKNSLGYLPGLKIGQLKSWPELNYDLPPHIEFGKGLKGIIIRLFEIE